MEASSALSSNGRALCRHLGRGFGRGETLVCPTTPPKHNGWVLPPGRKACWTRSVPYFGSQCQQETSSKTVTTMTAPLNNHASGAMSTCTSGGGVTAGEAAGGGAARPPAPGPAAGGAAWRWCMGQAAGEGSLRGQLWAAQWPAHAGLHVREGERTVLVGCVWGLPI